MNRLRSSSHGEHYCAVLFLFTPFIFLPDLFLLELDERGFLIDETRLPLTS